MKIKLLLFAVATLLMSACISNNITEPNKPADKGFAPIIHATQGNDDKASTRAGVIEDNDYTQGEKLYWNIGDEATVDFSGTRLEYKVTAVGEPRNQATFATNNTLPTEGTYDITGYFPTSAWTLGTTTHEAIIPAVQTQTDRTSAHLGAHMLMIAKSDGVTVDGQNSINLSYKHLASVLRLAVWNNTGKTNMKLTNINLRLAPVKAVFSTSGRLTNTDAGSLTIDNRVPAISLVLTGEAQNFELKDSKKQCEGYMAMLPTATNISFAPADDLVIELKLTDGVNGYTVIKTYNVGTELKFLENGIKQGSSYYIRLKVNSGDLAQAYYLGDYYPAPDVNLSDAEEKAKIQGIVYWLERPASGKSTKGRIVSLDEGTIMNWANATTWCSKKGADWHLPAKYELQYLYCTYNGKPVEEWNIMKPSFSKDKDACNAFDDKLSKAGGTILTADFFWSSEGSGGGKACVVNFSSGYMYNDPKTYSHRVRAVRSF